MLLVFAALLPFSAGAHVGSPNIFFENRNSAYPVRVSIRPPEVVPGLAEIHVRLFTNTVTRVTVLPVRWDAGRKGAPQPDVAALVKGETNLYSAQLWLMDMGAYSVFVNIEGTSGPHTEIVPLNSVALRRLPMNGAMEALFALLGALLFLGLIAIIGAAVRESTLAPATLADPRRKRRSWYAAGFSAVVLASIIVIGKRWWDRVDIDFRRNRLYQTRPAIAQINPTPQGNELTIKLGLGTERWHDSTPLVTDHGKLMHLFLARPPGLDVFAHLHPVRSKGNDFRSPLPPLPPGKYWAYADVTHESGFAETYTTELEIGPGTTTNSETSDPDDSWLSAEHQSSLKIERISSNTVKTGEDITMAFRILDSNHQPAQTELYMGMPAHAEVLRQDGTVFTHLHPLGTISMAAQQVFAKRDASGAPLSSYDVLCGKPSSEVQFPYAFPKAGTYRVWVQARSAGEIVSAPFDFQVTN
ncbi:MAG: hypothetical protein JWM99_4135 [Verrucomicrobiales bacterium]|nr:hypothetical protein [Verrucomicrobiales bacterium]